MIQGLACDDTIIHKYLKSIEDLSLNSECMKSHQDEDKIPYEIVAILQKCVHIKSDMLKLAMSLDQKLSFLTYGGITSNVDKEKYCVDLLHEAEQALILQTNLIVEAHEEVIQSISVWKFAQRQPVNCNTKTSLNNLQECSEELTDILWTALCQIKKLESIQHFQSCILGDEDLPIGLSALKNKISSLLSSLLLSSFVVVQQPPQILKDHQKFSSCVTVRHLSGHILNAQRYFPHVTVHLIHETTVKKLLGNNSNGIKEGINIVSRPSELKYNRNKNVFSASFEPHQMRIPSFLENIRKSPSKDSWEEKFCLYFETYLSTSDTTFKVWTTSSSTVIINDISQHTNATAFMFWDYKFGKIIRERLVVPSQVPWDLCAKALSQKFEAKTGRGINEINIDALKTRLLGVYNPSNLVTWSDFSKTKLPNSNFTFWKWCYKCMLLINNYFPDLWRDGFIVGIIDKVIAEQILLGCQAGTFIVRFSYSILGAVSVSWIDSDKQVYHVRPMERNELKTESLADTIMRLSKLVFLYPNIPKENVFQKYCTHNYVRRTDLARPVTVRLRDVFRGRERFLARA